MSTERIVAEHHYSTVIDNYHAKGVAWVIARRHGIVIEHIPLESRSLDEAIEEAKAKYPDDIVLVPRRGELIP